jgi:hypothetical protein
MADLIDLNKLEHSNVSKEVLDVYKRVKKHMIDDEDRKDWKRIRTRCWNAAYPLDPEKDDTIWTAKEREQMIKREQIPVAVNDLARDIQGASALITSKSPGLNFLPIGSSDLYVAELMKRGWDYVMNGNQGPVTLYDIVKEKNIGNLAVMEAKHDPSLGIFGKILVKDLDPEHYYFDKKSRERDHSDVNFGKAHLVTKDYALENYEGLSEDDLNFEIIKEEDKDGRIPDGKTGQDTYAADTNENPGQPEEKDEDREYIWEIEDWELKKEREFWVLLPDASKPSGIIKQTFSTRKGVEEAGWMIQPDGKTVVDAIGEVATFRPCMVTKRIQRIVVGKKLISTVVNPLGVDAEGAPILPIVTLQEDRTLTGYPTGKTVRALELTRSRNKRRMQSIYVVSKQVDATLVRAEGSKWVEDEKHGDQIVETKDAQNTTRRLAPGVTSAEMVNLEQIDKQDIHDEYQINDVIQGKIPPGQTNIAGRTVLALQDMVGVISSPQVLTFESALVKLGKAVAALMLMVWPRQMWMRLIEPDEWETWRPDKEKQQVDPQTGQPMQPQANVVQQKWQDAINRITGENGQEKLTPVDIDVKIIAESIKPTNRMAKQGVAMELVKAGIYDAQAALDYVDDPKKDEIVERLERKRQEELEAIRQGEAVKQASKGGK